MERTEILSTLRAAHDEIVRLRREIDVLKPKAHAYDTIAAIAGLSVRASLGGEGFAPDPAWRIKRLVDRIEAERRAKRGAEREEDPNAEDTRGPGESDQEIQP